MKPVISSILAFLLFLSCLTQAPVAYSNENGSNQEPDAKEASSQQLNMYLAEELAALLSDHKGADLLVVDSNLKPLVKVKGDSDQRSSEKIRFESMFDGENNEIDVETYNQVIVNLLRGKNITEYSSDIIANLVALSIDTQTHNEDKETNYATDVQSVVWVRSELKDLIYREIEGPMKNADHIFRALSRNDGAVLINSKEKLADQTLNLISLAVMYDRIRRHEITAKSEGKKNLYGRIAEILRQRIRGGFEGLSKLSADSGYNTYYDTGLTKWVWKRRLGAVRLAKYFWLSLMAPRSVVTKTIQENRAARQKKSQQSYGEKFKSFVRGFSHQNRDKELEIKDVYDQVFNTSSVSEEQIRNFETLSELMKPFEEKVAKTKFHKRLGRVLLSGLVGAMGGALFNRPLSDLFSKSETGTSIMEFTESFGDWMAVTFEWMVGYYPDLTMTTMALDMGVGTMFAYMAYRGLVNLSKHVSTRDFFTDQSRNRKSLLYKILKEHKIIRSKVNTCASQLVEPNTAARDNASPSNN